MDLDTTKSKNAYDRIINKIENQKTDILVGTQMITKGLDFEHVSVVGILNADNLMNFPDFRAHERAFQLISQVSGRAGRKNNRGNVVIQTSNPDHALLQLVISHDFIGFFRQQMEERLIFRFPPFYRLIKLTVKHKNIETVNRVSNSLAEELKRMNDLIVMGPGFPLINRIQLWYHKEIWIKLDKNLNQQFVKAFILQSVTQIRQQSDNNTCLINIDVDPV